MKHVCQTVLPNVYILVHSWTADQEFKCSLFLISRYYSHCMLCPKPVTPFGHESQQCFHLTGSKETQVLSTCNSRLYSQWFLPAFLSLLHARLHAEQYKPLIFKESTFPKTMKGLTLVPQYWKSGWNVPVNPHPPRGLSLASYGNSCHQIFLPWEIPDTSFASPLSQGIRTS